MRFFDFLRIHSVKCDVALSEPRSDIGEWSYLGLMSPQIRLTWHFARSRSVMHGDFWSDFFLNFENIDFLKLIIVLSIWHCQNRIGNRKRVRTMRLDVVFMNFCVFSRCVMLSCLSCCVLIIDTVSTSPPHGNHGWRFAVRNQVSWTFRFSKFSGPWHRSLFVPSSDVTHLFGDMTPRIESHMRKKQLENTVGPNELTDFETFKVEHPETIKTILATNSPNHPGDCITLRRNRSSSHIIICKASAARQWNSRQGRKFIENYSFRRHQRRFFMKFWIFKIFGSMIPKLVRTKLRRYAFVWRYDTTNRKPHAKKQ